MLSECAYSEPLIPNNIKRQAVQYLQSIKRSSEEKSRLEVEMINMMEYYASDVMMLQKALLAQQVMSTQFQKGTCCLLTNAMIMSFGKLEQLEVLFSPYVNMPTKLSLELFEAKKITKELYGESMKTVPHEFKAPDVQKRFTSSQHVCFSIYILKFM